MVPSELGRVRALGLGCLVESGAGLGAFHTDESYRAAGAEVVSREELHARADAVLVLRPGAWARPRPGTLLIGLLADARPEGVDAFALERLPRISRAQSMDALSTLGTLAGYEAAVLAAAHCPRFFPMLTTAAGTVAPAEVLVLGAGVAGLTAMATARRLGAVVTGYDIRPAAQEEIRSVGARCLAPPTLVESGPYASEQTREAIERQQTGLGDAVARSHVVIGTASVPGRPAPVLLTAAMVERMPAGSLIVDLAGGNCELAEHERVRILRESDLTARLPVPASQMLARNLVTFLALLARDGELSIPWEDELVGACCVARR